MSLSTAIDISNSSLAATSQLTSIASRNIANVNNKEATRKQGVVVTEVGGGARVAVVSRTFDRSLRDALISATSDSARSSVVAVSLDVLDLSAGASSGVATPESRLGALRSALQSYSLNTADQSLAASVVSAASDMAATLRHWAINATQVRSRADDDIRVSVDKLNDLLRQTSEANAAVVNGSSVGRDVTDQLDARDALVSEIAEQVGITVVAKANNGIAIYTDSGITLFDEVPRAVAFEQFPIRDGAPGGTVIIDGVPAIGASAVMPVVGGRITGLAEVRDKIVPMFSSQLDDMAGSLIRAFSEADQRMPPSAPDLPGLFTVAGTVAIPVAGASKTGLAGTIIVNPNSDPAAGGSLLRLRDGGISQPGNPAYVYNSTGSTAFAGRVQQLLEALATPVIHGSASGLSGDSNISDFMSASSGWMQAQRKAHTDTAANANVFLERSQQAWSSNSGVNLDDEMAQLLGLERTYQASAKLIATVDEMYAALMQAIG